LARDLAGPDSNLPLSAQGLWAATLIDTGALGLAFWVMLLGGALVLASHRMVREPTPLGAAVLFALTAALLSSQMAGDRLGLGAWSLLGLLLAMTTVAARRADRVEVPREPGPIVERRAVGAS